MTRGERYRSEAQRLDRAGAQKMDEADGLTVGVEAVPDDVQQKADGLYKEAEALFERSQFYKTRAAEAEARDADERTAGAERERSKWRERATGNGNPRTSDLNDMPTVEQLRERSRHLALRLRGEHHDADVANRTYPVEGLYAKVIRSKVPGLTDPDPMTPEERSAYSDYAKLAERALAPTQSSAVAGKGAELVPENMANRIFAASKLYGGFADLLGVSQFVQQSPGTFKVPTSTDVTTLFPSRTAEAADVALSDTDTGEVEVPINNFAIQLVLTDQLLMSDVVSLESFLVSRMGQQFGGRINQYVTSGTGVNQPKGVTAIAAGRKVAIGTDGSLDEDDIFSLLKHLDGSYHGRPTTFAHAHFNTILDISKMRDNGQLVFPRTPDGLTTVLPGGTRLVANNQLVVDAAGNTAASNVMLIGDHMEYALVTDGPMRFERARELRSYQWLLSWNQFLGGSPVIEDAWAVLRGS